MAAEGEPVARRRGRPPADGGPRERSQVQSLTRALSLLDAVAAAASGATLTDLAKRVGLPASTAHRLLSSLEQQDFVRQDPERGHWYVGVRAFTIGNAFLNTRDYVALARPVMIRLMQAAGESVSLAVRDDIDMVFLAQVECGAVMRVLSRPGGRAPLHCSGLGKAVLASLPQADAAALCGRLSLNAYTPRTCTTASALVADIEATRARGYAVDDEEFAQGLRCVAAVLRDERGQPLAAISLSGPTARVSAERVAPFGQLVRDAAAEITRALGGRA